MSIIAPEKLDRRVQRTRAQLKQALLALIVEQGYDDLTIQDITDRADLRRATFYLHYRDKEELLFSALGDSFQALLESSSHHMEGDPIAGKTQVEPYLALLQHVADYHQLYRTILASTSGARIAARLRDFLADILLQTLPSQDHLLQASEVPREAIAYFMAGSELALITWWLDTNMPYSVAQFAAIMHTLLLNGVRAAIPLGELRGLPESTIAGQMTL